MTQIYASFDATAVQARPLHGPALETTVLSDWPAAEPRWERLTEKATALPFGRAPWLRAWYRHCAGPGIEPVIVFLRDRDTGQDLLALPLVRRREGPLRVLSFADDGLTDYNAPPFTAAAAPVPPPALWAAIRRALPPADLLRFEKMPAVVDGRPNPLAAMPGTAPSTLIGNILHVPGTWDEWHWDLERTFRKELERAGRVFEKNPGAEFRRYEAGPAAERVYGELERLQATRIAELGLPYILDDEGPKQFYETVAREGLRDGTAVLTALTIGDEVVAALLGITDGTHYAMTRLATPGPQWKSFSPGRLLIERTMKMLHAEGFRAFDFTIGDYSYKRRIGVTPVPMVESLVALSPLGWPVLAKARAKAMLKRHPWIVSKVRELRGRKAEPVTH